MRHRVAAVLAALIVFASYFATMDRFENDHFVIIARARQVLFGDWPVRDFIDPGMPLTYLVSAAAAAIAGPNLLTEAVLSIGLIALTAAIVTAIAGRVTNSVIGALLAASMTMAIPTRLYSASKVACIAVALWLASRYARTARTRDLAVLGVWTGIAYLLRVDYALFVGAASIVLIALTNASWRDRLKAAATYAAIAFAVVLPWLIYVEALQGLGEYIASAVRFAEAERARTAARVPWFDRPLLSPPNVNPALFYGFIAVPCLALILTLKMPRSPLRAEVTFAAVLTLLCDVAFLRDAIAGRIGDVAAPTAVLIAWLAVRLLPRRAFPAIGLSATAVLLAAALSVFRQQGGSLAPATAIEQWARVAGRLHGDDPELAGSGAILDVAAYIARCTLPGERVLVSGFAPEIPVLAGRPFAGGLPSFLLGYYVLDPDQRTVERHLQRGRVGAVVLLEGRHVFAVSWPPVARQLLDDGFQEHAFAADEPNLLVWVRPGNGAGGVDAETGLPCRRSEAPRDRLLN